MTPAPTTCGNTACAVELRTKSMCWTTSDLRGLVFCKEPCLRDQLRRVREQAAEAAIDAVENAAVERVRNRDAGQ